MHPLLQAGKILSQRGEERGIRSGQGGDGHAGCESSEAGGQEVREELVLDDRGLRAASCYLDLLRQSPASGGVALRWHLRSCDRGDNHGVGALEWCAR